MRALLQPLHRFLFRHKLRNVLIVGIVVRAALAPFFAHPFDMYAWYKIYMKIVQEGPLSLRGFPPLWYHCIMVPIAYLYDWLAKVFSVGAIPMDSIPSELDFYPAYKIEYIPGPLFNLLVKFPFVLSDVLVALLLYKTVMGLTDNIGLAEKAALLWFLNPQLIWISAGWGMWDSIPALFSSASLYLLLRKRVELSSVCLSLAVASKLYPALFLLPITVYFLKVSPAEERWKNCLRFHSVFLATSTLLFLPYISQVISFSGEFFVPTSSSITGAVADPIVNPIGFGLTYWSIYLLNRPFNIRINEYVAALLITVSSLLVIFSLTLTYWKIGRLTFRRPIFDLAAVMLSCILALFLSHRIICEQFFVWLMPFLSIACVGGRTKESLYLGSSLIALLYSVLNCPLPFFLLPLAPWTTGTLLGMVKTVWAMEPIRMIILSFLGSSFSLLMLTFMFQHHRNDP